jgi:hypothetical protein
VLGGGGYCDAIFDTPCKGGDPTTEIGVKRFGSHWPEMLLKGEETCKNKRQFYKRSIGARASDL